MMSSVENGVTVAIYTAMQGEAEHLITGLSLEQEQQAPFPLYTNPQGDVVLMTPGVDSRFLDYNGHPVSRVGPEYAAAAGSFLIAQFNPKILLNVGTAGGLGEAQPGDVYIGAALRRHGQEIALPGYNDFVGRTTDLEEPARKVMDVLQKDPVEGVTIRNGLVSTGHSFVQQGDSQTIAQLHDAGVHVVEMEADGLQAALDLYQRTLLLIIVKGITDNPDLPEGQKEFIENFDGGIGNATKVTEKIIFYRDDITAISLTKKA